MNINKMLRFVCLLAVAAILFVPIGFSNAGIRYQADTASGEDAADTGIVVQYKSLPVVGDVSTLKNLVADTYNVSPMYYLDSVKTKSATMSQSADVAVAGDSGAGRNSALNGSNINNKEQNESAASQITDYSKTNIQVQGVDEADIVKTDGQYIYQVNAQRIVIIKAYPADKMEIAAVLDMKERNIVPMELYIDADKMVVIGTGTTQIPYRMIDGSAGAPQMESVQSEKFITGNTVKAVVYELGEHKEIKLLRELELDGYYVSSRKIGSSLYIVASKNIDMYNLENGGSITPCYRDTAVKEEFITPGLDEIKYIPDMVAANYMIIAGFDINAPESEACVSTYLGAGENIYVTDKNLYVAVSSYKAQNDNTPRQTDGDSVQPQTDAAVKPDQTSASVASDMQAGAYIPPQAYTSLYKFSLDNGKNAYICSGEVPGKILNQFSMDENGEYFRIATTTGEVWRNDEFTSRNNIYVLDSGLKVAGRIEDIAPGERIYSTRFMGDRAYMVTFKKVDPLFVLDLKDPVNPRILGALKIPGYSDYLHPYDENHIIGFGKDTIETGIESGNGADGGTMAYYQGMKIALFDVTDVSNPKQEFSEIIGDRGTDSELLRNHKALMFSKEKNLLAFPVTLMEVKNSGQQYIGGKPAVQYGEFTFQGAYIYSIDAEKGFVLKGKVTHLTDQDYLKSGYNWYRSKMNIERILFINDTLYTISQGMVKANNIADIAEINSLSID